jgi:hypothetical protein
MNKNKMQVCFVNTDQIPLSTKHLSFFASKDADNIHLHEVVEETYPHPEAPECAVIQLITTRFIEQFSRLDKRASAAILLEAAQNQCMYQKIAEQSK